ncbi:MFS-type transporter SLC18B1 [Liparis tanakae]|uniref:MFS-type transporter SLC18B1 n=1 Tax=Liparis tanakae TaxID=230148 RepID=A0A4Z2FSW9_9TELE|nr:MFS-type transporter SLC18B1 [Liparis tanakae]
MICYSILGPFFPNEKKSVSGLLRGMYERSCARQIALPEGQGMTGSVEDWFSRTGPTGLRLLDRVPSGATFITLCFVVRSVDALGFAAAMTSTFAMTARIFPNNVATVLGSLEVFTGLGLILGPPLGGWFYQLFGYEVPFMLLGGLLLVMVPFNIYVLPSIEADPSKDSFFPLLTKGKIILTCYAVFTLSGGLGFLDATLSLFAIAKVFGLSVGHVGLILLGLSLPYCLVSPIIGFITDKYPSTRCWFVVSGGIATAFGFFMLGPAPFLHIPSPLWLLVLMLGVVGLSLAISVIPMFPEIITCAYEKGYEEGLGTLGMVSGLFGAFWSLGMFYGPTVGGLITQHLSFEWAAAVQGGLSLLGAFLLAVYYLCHPQQQQQSAGGGGRAADERTRLLVE